MTSPYIVVIIVLIFVFPFLLLTLVLALVLALILLAEPLLYWALARYFDTRSRHYPENWIRTGCSACTCTLGVVVAVVTSLLCLAAAVRCCR